jgi:hypothetical protein
LERLGEASVQSWGVFLYLHLAYKMTYTLLEESPI